MTLTYAQDMQMRRYFEEHFGKDVHHEDVEWYIDGETSTVYHWNFVIAGKGYRMTYDKGARTITHKEFNHSKEAK